MVKPDASRDYYNDLELPPGASVEEVKKQYRKLALQFHPDRNPGKEAEASERFQAIGAAHEVLADPELRQKYDNSRMRGNVHSQNFAKPAPPRRNPYPFASNFPPPPRRGDPRYAGPHPQDVPPTNANAGAQRYARNFPAPPPPSMKPNPAGDSQTRTSNLYAWQNLAGPQKTHPNLPPRPQNYPHIPPSYKHPHFKMAASPPGPEPETTRPRQSVDASYPRSAYDEVRAPGPRIVPTRTPSMRAPKKGGFDPTATTPFSDESQAPGANSYSSNPRPNRLSRDGPQRMKTDTVPQPPPRGAAPTSKRVDPPSHFRANSGDATAFGEIPRKSTPYHTGSTGDRISLGGEPLRRSFSTRDNARLHEDHLAQAESLAGRKGSMDSMNGHGGRNAAGKQDPRAPRASRPFANPEFGSDDDGDSTLDSSLEAEHGFKDDTPSTGTGASDSSTETASSHANPNDRPKAQPSQAWTARQGRASGLGKSKSLEEQNAKMAQGPHAKDSQNHPFPINGETFQRNSHPDIRSTSFHPPEDAASQNAQDQDSRPSTTDGSPQSMPRRGRATSLGLHSNPVLSNETRQRIHGLRFPTEQADASEARDTNFSSDEWKKSMEGEDWATRFARPPSQPQNTSPTRRPNQRKQRTPNLRNPVFEGGSGEPSSAGVSPKGHEPPHSRTFSIDQNGMQFEGRGGDAMDIDDPEDQQSSVTAETGLDTGLGPGAAMTPAEQSSLRSGERQYPSGFQRDANTGPATGISMNDFRHVEPLNSKTSGGINNMTDLKSDLPTESQASSKHPKDILTSDMSDEETPKPPKPPRVPKELNAVSWNGYVSQLPNYLRSWNRYYVQMAVLSQERAIQGQEMMKGPSGGMVDGWLGVVEGTGTLGDFDTYTGKVTEDDAFHCQLQLALGHHLSWAEQHNGARRRLAEGGFRSGG